MKLYCSKPTYYAINIVCLFWLVAKIMSYNLWVNDRLFPTIAIHTWLDNMPNFYHQCLYFTSIILLSTYSIIKPNKALLLILLIVEILSCILDYNRWQPWQYQYICMLYVFISCINDYQKATQWFALILGCTYLYSGFYKFNYFFIHNMWVETILKEFAHLSATQIKTFKLTNMGFALPLIEFAAAVGLFYKHWQKKAAITIICMHIGLLVILGPIGINYNHIVWPWNIAMILLVYTIFVKKHTAIVNFNLLLKPSLYIIAFLWVLMPLANYFGKWPTYLSSNLYSSKAIGLKVKIKDSKASQNLILKYVDQKINEQNIIYLQNWALKELNTPQFPEWFCYQKMAKKLKQIHHQNIEFEVYNTPKNDSLTLILNK